MNDTTTDSDPADMEAMAALEHESWAGWTVYMLERIETELGEAVALSPDDPVHPAVHIHNALHKLLCVERWKRQIATSYTDLPEKEKASDRIEVRKKLPTYRPEERRPSTETERETCQRLGCAPGAWRDACPLHGHGKANAAREAAAQDRADRSERTELVKRMTTAVLGELDIAHASEPTIASLVDRINSVLNGGR